MFLFACCVLFLKSTLKKQFDRHKMIFLHQQQNAQRAISWNWQISYLISYKIGEKWISSRQKKKWKTYNRWKVKSIWKIRLEEIVKKHHTKTYHRTCEMLLALVIHLLFTEASSESWLSSSQSFRREARRKNCQTL